MCINLISKILLVTFDKSKPETIRQLQKSIEESGHVKVFNFDDIREEYARETCYADKLKRALDGVKLVLLVNAQWEEFSFSLSDQGLDGASGNNFCLFLNLEMKLSREETKIVFVSLGDDIKLPTTFGDVNHFENLVKHNGGVCNDALNHIFEMCRKPLRVTFPMDEESRGNDVTIVHSDPDELTSQ